MVKDDKAYVCVMSGRIPEGEEVAVSITASEDKGYYTIIHESCFNLQLPVTGYVM